MPSEARQKKIVEKLNRAQKCSILGPQNLGSGGGARAPGAPPLDPHLNIPVEYSCLVSEVFRVCLVRGLKVKCTVSQGLFAAFPKFRSADYNNSQVYQSRESG